MKGRIYTLGVLLIIVVLYVGSCSRAGIWLVKKDKLVHADIMVILMGSIADRVLQATEVFKQGMADKVLIVKESMVAYKELEERGVHVRSTTEMVSNATVALGVPAERIIILPGDATSTQMEAKIISDYLANNRDIDTLLLVSSPSHTRRASMIFKYALRKADEPVYILCSPSNYTDFDPRKWWRSKEGIQTVLMEYLKMMNFMLFDRIE